jgi:hypothetical protein
MTFVSKSLLIMSLLGIGHIALGDDKTKSPKTKWGEKISMKDELPLSKAIENKAVINHRKTVLITGVTKKVCVKKGCWMIIKDGAYEARVTFKDYGFFVDQSLAGKKIRAQGTVSQKTVSKSTAEHYLVDEGMDPKEAAKKAKEEKTYQVIASGVEVVM